MIEHSEQQEPLETGYRRIDEPPGEEQSIERRPATFQHQIESYLDKACALAGNASPLYRQELRSKLEATIAAHRELGSQPYEAIALAISESQAERLAERSANAVKSQPRRREEASDRRATMLAFGMFGLPYVAEVTELSHRVASAIGMTETTLYASELLVVPFVSGLVTGMLIRRRAVFATLTAIAILAIPAVIWPGILVGLGYAGILDHYSPIFGHMVPNPMAGYSGFGLWLIMGGAGAWVGSRARSLEPRISRWRRRR
jgi:hypothetical protein